MDIWEYSQMGTKSNHKITPNEYTNNSNSNSILKKQTKVALNYCIELETLGKGDFFSLIYLHVALLCITNFVCQPFLLCCG